MFNLDDNGHSSVEFTSAFRAVGRVFDPHREQTFVCITYIIMVGRLRPLKSQGSSLQIEIFANRPLQISHFLWVFGYLYV